MATTNSITTLISWHNNYLGDIIGIPTRFKTNIYLLLSLSLLSNYYVIFIVIVVVDVVVVVVVATAVAVAVAVVVIT